MSRETLAVLLGVSAVTVWRWEHGRRPSHEAADKILRETAGAVTPNDFFDLPAGAVTPAAPPTEEAA